MQARFPTKVGDLLRTTVEKKEEVKKDKWSWGVGGGGGECGWGVEGEAHKVWALNCAVGRLELGGRSQREAPVLLSVGY